MSISPLRRLPTDAARLDEVLGELGAHFAANAARHDADGSFPHENCAVLHRHGLIARVVPRAYGGDGASLSETRKIIAGVAAGDPATALVLTMNYLQHRAIGRADTRWPEAARQQVFASAVEDGALMNALRAEPHPHAAERFDPDCGRPGRTGGLT
jgi:alkylation response protein AidB-like acyl-CoA dehydrogenase